MYRHDQGFTLVETVVVVALLSFVMAVVAATFTVIVRNSPSVENRTDDARSLLGLTNWLSQDVMSTAENGFEDSTAADRCTGLPVGSTSIVQLRWTEGDTYVANYRWVPSSGTSGSIVRFSCRAGQAAASIRVTAPLERLPAAQCSGATPPSECPVPVDLAIVPGSPGSPPSLSFAVYVVEDTGVRRELLELDASTSNVITTLPPLGGGGGGSNLPPLAGPASLTMTVGTSAVLDLSPLVSDPNGDSLNVTFANTPPGWNVTAIGTLATITPLPADQGTFTFDYTVADPGSLSATSTVTVTVQAVAANLPPTASPVSVVASPTTAATVSLPASDPEGGALTASISGLPGSWGRSISGLTVTLTPPASASGTYTFNYTVSDPLGASATSTITVNVCDAEISSVAPSTVSVDPFGVLSSSVTITINHNGFCSALVLGYLPNGSTSVESTKSFNTGTTVTILTTDHVWDYANRNVTLNLREGSNGPILDDDRLRTVK